MKTDQIIQGNAIEILQQLPANSIDLVITSPPYFHQREYKTDIFQPGVIGNEPTVDEYITNLIAIFRECIRVIRTEGSVIFNLGDKYENGSLLLVPYRFAIEALKIPGIKLLNQITWVKLNPVPKQDPRKLISATEPFFVFVKSDLYTFNKSAFLNHNEIFRIGKNSGKNRNKVGQRYFKLIEQSDLTLDQKIKAQQELDNVIHEVQDGKLESFRMKIRGLHALPYGGQDGGRMMHLSRDGFTIIKIHGNALKRDIIESPVETIKGNLHPAVYPEYLIQEFLKLFTNPGHIVLDPFIGSGTTGVVAKRMNRHFLGIEISSEYCALALKRINETQPDLEQEMVF
jgi:DNA modification methylase